MKRRAEKLSGRILTVILSAGIVLSTTACGSTTATVQKETKQLEQVVSSVAVSENKKTDTNVSGSVAQPDGFPSKTIEVIVPAAAGGVIDLYTRALNDHLDLGTPLKITNMVGGSQTLGLMELAGRKADGYSIGTAAFAGLIIQPQLVNVTYTHDSFRPIAIISGPNVYSICVKADTDVTDYESFMSMLKDKDTVHWSSPNAGSPGQLAGLYYLDKAGITNCEYVSYNGTAEGITALLGGDIDFLVVDDNVVATREADGQVKGVLTLSGERSKILPEVVCAKEASDVDGMEAFSTFTLMTMPADTPDEIYNWIKQQVDLAVTSDGYQKYIKSNNLPEMKTYTEQEMKDMVSNATVAISEVVQAIK